MLGGWFLVEAAVLSLSKGIVHPYYVSALAPGTGAMAGAGAVAFVELARGPRRGAGARSWRRCALAGTVLVQVVLMHREHYMLWFVPVLASAPPSASLALLALRRLAAPAVALTFLLLLVAPAAYATTTWLAPVEGTFPVAGPKAFAGAGGYGVDAHDLAIDHALLDYVATHHPGSRWALLTVASDTGSPLILMGLDAGALGGYSGTDPALDGPRLARLVARGEARYVLLGGEYSLRGGNLATKAVLRACRELAPSEWHSPIAYPYGLVLFDCAGDEARARAAEARGGAALRRPTDRSRWNARANSSRSRPAAQRGTAGLAVGDQPQLDLTVLRAARLGASARAGRASARGPRPGAAAPRSGPGARSRPRRTAPPSGRARACPCGGSGPPGR